MAMVAVLVLLLLVPAAILVSPCFGATGDNILFEEETLSATQGLARDSYFFVMQPNCNLVLYDDTTPLWSSKTGGIGRNCYVTLTKKGNLVLYSAEGKALWQTVSSSPVAQPGMGYILFLQKDGNLVIYGNYGFYEGLGALNHLSLNFTAQNKLVVESVREPTNILSAGEVRQPTNILSPGETLKGGESLYWNNLNLTMENDCRLVMYESNKQVSSIDNSGKGFTGCYLECNVYGNPAIYDSKGTWLWGTSYTQFPKGNYLFLLKDRMIGTLGPSRWSLGLTHSSGEKIAMVTKD